MELGPPPPVQLPQNVVAEVVVVDVFDALAAPLCEIPGGAKVTVPLTLQGATAPATPAVAMPVTATAPNGMAIAAATKSNLRIMYVLLFLPWFHGF
jgi:hypothetical protein